LCNVFTTAQPCFFAAQKTAGDISGKMLWKWTMSGLASPISRDSSSKEPRFQIATLAFRMWFMRAIASLWTV